MKEATDACQTCRESMESYVSGDIGRSQARDVAFHLAECDECAAYYASQRELIESLRALPSGLEPLRPVSLDLSQAQRPRPPVTRWWQVAAAAAAALALLAVSALAVPAFAAQIPVLPVSTQLERLQSERDQLEAEAETLSDRVEQLEVEIKQIGGESVPVVDTAPGAVSPEVNDAVQRLAMEFIRAQYDGDKSALKALSTDRLAAAIDRDPDGYLKQRSSVVFAQMTTVAKADDGSLLLFVRLSDAEFFDSTYQENFEIRMEGGKYFVDFVGMDA
jgi:hypothetical protein